MNCEGAQVAWARRLRRALGADEAADLDRHVGTCPACRADVEEAETAWRVARHEEERPVPAGVRERALRVPDEAPRIGASVPARPSGTLRRIAWTAAACLLAAAAVGGALATYHRGPGWLRGLLGRSGTSPGGGEEAPTHDPFPLPEVALHSLDGWPGAGGAPPADRIAWMSDLDAAREFSRYSALPILYFVCDEGSAASRQTEESLREGAAVRASRDFLCVRHTPAEYRLGLRLHAIPTFFIFEPDGDLLYISSGAVDAGTLQGTLLAARQLGQFPTGARFLDLRRRIEEARGLYVQKRFGEAHARARDVVEGSGTALLRQDAGAVLAAIDAYVRSKHAFARSLVANGENERARAFYAAILKEFGGLPIHAELRAEMEALPPE
ncbi:MAG: hypothetical protein HY608_01090 [Planctomycetes bacterium]|nr:hypothetical protein [Planctomycetota bacterium]